MASNVPSFTPDPGGLDPAQVHYLTTARRRIRDQYGIGVTQNSYQTRTLRNQYARGKADLSRQFYQARQQLPSPYAQAGLLNSGLYQLGLSRFGQERRGAFGNLSGEFNDELRGLRLARTQLGQVKRQGLRDIDAEEAARRAALASSLTRVS
jgi:hypothetical protein